MKCIVDNRNNVYPGTTSIADLAINTAGIKDTDSVAKIISIMLVEWKFELQLAHNMISRLDILFVDKTKLIFYKY